jgi:hypothetical protein
MLKERTQALATVAILSGIENEFYRAEFSEIALSFSSVLGLISQARLPLYEFASKINQS